MEYCHQRSVSSSDTDAAGVVHFSRVLCYVEEAEHALLKSLGIPLLDGGGWPRVDVQCSYSAPIMPDENIQVEISPAELGRSSILWKFTIISGEKVCATGSVKTVRVNENGKPVELDPIWREKLNA